MSIERAKAALNVFETALGIERATRADWVRQACDGDTDLAAEVHSLLAVHQQAGDFLDGAPPSTPTLLVEGFALPQIAAGHQLDDFVIEEQIGAGGMGIVYRARQLSLNRCVALKVLPPHLRYSENAQTRFQREVEAAARLGHPNIVAVYTMGEDNGTIYYAMELIDGPALSEVIESLKRHPLPELQTCMANMVPTSQLQASTRSRAGDVTVVPERPVAQKVDLELLCRGKDYFDAIATVIANVADGLQYAHDMKVIHRDVKPSNLLLSADGEIHIGDFGLARITHEPGLTRTGEMIGTPYYMAPEQVLPTGVVDERTDVYALGATLYELLTLRPPFGGERREQVISQIGNAEPVLPRTINRLVPRDLETICLKTLEKNPSRRYQSAEELAADLRRYVGCHPILARPLSPLGRSVRWVQRHRTWAAAISTMCLLAIVAMFFAYRTYRSESRWTDAQYAQLFETAQLTALEGNIKRAADAIDDAEKLGAPESQLFLLRGQLALQSGEFQEACDSLEAAVREMPDSAAAHALLANAYEFNEEHEKSARVARLLPTLKPVTLQDHLLLGQAQFYSDFATGLATLDQAVQLDKTSVQARLTRGSLLAERAMDTGDAQTAERALDDLRIASELLDPNSYLLGNVLQARLIAATAYEAEGNEEQRQQHLREAAHVAESLENFPEQYQSHRWRGLYFEYIGDDEKALESWLAMKQWQIAYLVLALFRQGEVDHAVAVCDERLARIARARSTQFFRSVAMSVRAESPEELLAGFAPRGEETLDAINLHRFNYSIQCLAGELECARELSRGFREKVPSETLKDPWRAHLVAYTCGDIDDDTFVERSANSRIALCQAHYFIGLTQLASSNREAARQHFRAAADLKIVGYLEDPLSRAFLVQLDRDPQWPRWIPFESGETDELP